MSTSLNRILSLLILIVGGFSFQSCEENRLPYEDISHYSQVFGREKTYRLYLPDSYNKSNERFPVIYFFHGWGGRFFKDDSAKLEYEKLGELVNKYQVILVMWDGNIDMEEPRPYNVGDHKDVKFDIQMKDYFPELISHIDSTYKTLTDRDHRGIIGFSMGGFMSFYLAGKYPDQVSAAVNMVGSSEFFVGLPENHTLYQVRYTFENLRDVALLFHNRTNCPMSGLNDETNNGAVWSELPDYEYHKLEGDHMVDYPGETKVFESAMSFVAKRFEKKLAPPKQWSHYDLCPDFDLWGYSVKSKKDEPGFIFLRNVAANGLGFYTQKWLPIGPSLKPFQTSITTAPIYEPGSEYRISLVDVETEKINEYTLFADNGGKLKLELNGKDCEIAISKNDGGANFTTFGYQLTNHRKYLKVNQPEQLSFKILKRGKVFDQGKKVSLTLSCSDSAFKVVQPTKEVLIPKGEKIITTEPFWVKCSKTPPADASPEWLRINVEMSYDTCHVSDVVVLPVWYEVPELDGIQVDDGRSIAPTSYQGDFNKAKIDSIYGEGNADGIVSAGERIMLYKDDHRLRLFCEDPFVISEEETLVDEFLPGKWPDGFTQSSVVKISEDCPPNHEIEFMAHYETKTFMPMYRTMVWGKVKIKVNKSVN